MSVNLEQIVGGEQEAYSNRCKESADEAKDGFGWCDGRGLFREIQGSGACCDFASPTIAASNPSRGGHNGCEIVSSLIEGKMTEGVKYGRMSQRSRVNFSKGPRDLNSRPSSFVTGVIPVYSETQVVW